ncbi:MAG: DNA mismatch repair protein MutS, partial [Candidatus Eisenbacteria bacterium]
MEALTPMMRQYWKVKEQHPDAILFFRMGDFYEMFHRDAEVASQVLGLTLTTRSKGEETPIPLAGVPWHKADHYIDRLLRLGYKVAVCDQTEDPKKARGLVRREVTEVVTPGTALGGSLLDGKRPNYLVALAPGRGDRNSACGIAALDLATGDFRIGELEPEELAEEVARFEPSEILLPEGREGTFAPPAGWSREPVITRTEEWKFDAETGERELKGHFGVETLEGFGCADLTAGLAAGATLFDYLRALGRTDLRHIDRVLPIRTRDAMILDEATRRNLEIFRPIREGAESGTLLAVLDGTVTAMGGRLLREWLLRPLVDPRRIGERLDAVGEAVRRSSWREEVRDLLRRFGDLERLAGKIVLGRGTPRDVVALKNSLRLIPPLQDRFTGAESPLLSALAASAERLDGLADLVERAIADDPPLSMREGGVIRKGYDGELDDLRSIGTDGRGWIAGFQEQERRKTGIPNLKVGYNKIFGYYIEVSKSRAGEVPPSYTRKQTLVAAERYITPELKEQEERILGAEERIRAREEELFLEVRAAAAAEGPRIRRIGEAVAALDVLFAFADRAVRGKYARPVVDGENRIRIRKGRHPVVEA